MCKFCPHKPKNCGLTNFLPHTLSFTHMVTSVWGPIGPAPLITHLGMLLLGVGEGQGEGCSSPTQNGFLRLQKVWKSTTSWICVFVDCWWRHFLSWTSGRHHGSHAHTWVRNISLNAYILLSRNISWGNNKTLVVSAVITNSLVLKTSLRPRWCLATDYRSGSARVFLRENACGFWIRSLILFGNFDVESMWHL